MIDAPLLTLTLTPRNREAIKPAELIQVTGHHELTLNARRAITILWHHAHMQGVEESKDYTIEIDDLKPDGHKGYEMVEEAIEALMRTILTMKHMDGKTRRVQFLGGNDLDDPDRPAGVLTYSFDKRLVEILRDSQIWGRIAIPILMAFTSRYSVSLYENLAQFANLNYKTSAEYTVADFRQLMGVPSDRYKSFGEFNKHVLKPAIAEINVLAPFGVTVLPVKEGKKVVKINLGWWKKTEAGLREAYAEAQRPKVGRRARIRGTVEYVSAPLPSQERLRRISPEIS
ncbi:MAG TPA: RepB family plasmid replication initiator protein [Aurantimonas coralicida]|uniref:RepB family plasmid replication initiator protein n=2 Tax=root TaxID=1 RepID=A0A9C9NG23_9HYPH|nr:RepB family plasmid replication initiator protein [Aurantimonas coralicida]HEU00966.1 RepB family plasmid replication initiator protein [Aurantimonas coralicida]